MTESELIELLENVSHDHVIYYDKYTKHSLKIFEASKAKGMGTKEWLSANGFTMLNITEDMRSGENIKPATPSVEELIEYIFMKFPLAGQYIPTESEAELISEKAQQAFENILISEKGLDDVSCAALFLQTMYIIRGFDRTPSDEGVTSIWSYIYSQFGCKEINDRIKDRLYKAFRYAIERVTSKYKRYISPSEKTQRYYTTLMLHSIMPINSIESFFNILLYFYKENLDCRYIANDTSYSTFARNMSKRWNRSIYVSESIDLRSDSVASGLRSLFSKRQGYMAELSEEIVKKIDSLLNGNTSLLRPDENRWDLLLLDWYNRKSAEEKRVLRQQSRSASAERTETEVSNIRPQYIYENRSVYISLPNIRLDKHLDASPKIIVSVDGEEVLNENLSVFGRDITTIRSMMLPVGRIASENSFNFNIRIIIDGETKYNSENKLYRSFILFNSSGAECTPQNIVSGQQIFIAAPSSASFEIDGDSECLQISCNYQLYDIIVSENAYAYVNGSEVFADNSAKKSFRCHTNVKKADASALIKGSQYNIFSSDFTLEIRLPDSITSENLHLYRIHHNGEIIIPVQCLKDDSVLSINSCSDSNPHIISIVDFSSGKVVFEYLYIIIRGFSYSLDRKLYFEKNETAEISFTATGDSYICQCPIDFRNDTIMFSIGSVSADILVPVPASHCIFPAKKIAGNGEKIWYTDICDSDFIDISCPPEWKAELFLGNSSVPDIGNGQFEIGNFLKSYDTASSDEKLKAVFSYAEDNTELEIAEIFFKEKLNTPPISTENGKLIWSIEDNYIGAANSEFKVCVLNCGDFVGEFYTDTSDSELCAFETENALITYTVYLNRRSLFGETNKEIYKGSFSLGNPAAFAFNGKIIYLITAMCWKNDTKTIDRIMLPQNIFRISDIKYSGESVPDDESVSMPEYTGVLEHMNDEGYIPFSYDDEDGNEMINPVRFWVKNRNLIIMLATTYDCVQIHKRDKSILWQSPDLLYSRSDQMENLRIPDYFGYRIQKCEEE